LRVFNVRILIIEDNPDIAANIGDYLDEMGHTVDFAGDGVTGLHLAVVNDFDAIVLDLALPGMDGLEVCRKLRHEAKKDTPVLMLTARDRLEDKLKGFETGADDYLVKPFELQEVEARLKVLASRGKRHASKEMQIGDLLYNLDTLTVSRAGTEIDLNPIGLKLLRCLMEASPNVVTRAELEKEVWGEEMPDSDSLRVHIHSLRSAIDKPFGSKMIQTRHGIGYRLLESNAVPA
jgi:DNA-binding response OmpR family regulator